ncbi:pilus assembly protein TadG-related protein [Bradyrhizobium tropiciagri]|uniref:pilus assembly protein TadG-related protein n=1 Tax=Bradyrhizobium tropiciagri TaxID=312253 RepID=UPI00067DBF64|nr:pilus assembly protein TadG-related protein [Bradyrhizobium tropiciagri]
MINEDLLAFCSIFNHMRRLHSDERGAVNVVMGLLLIPLLGALGIGFEISNWFLTARGMQNAADSAVLAAATNGGSNYDVEAKAVAARYGFVSGVNNISIAVSNTAACPGSGNNCYSVTISGLLPLYLSQVVGYRGDATLSGTPAKQLGATAVAGHPNSPTDFCLVALGPNGIRTNGAPKANMQCNTMSNANSTCNGHDLGAPVGAAHGTNNGCGIRQYSNVPAFVDPYAAWAGKIPTNPCASYPQEPAKKKDPALPASNQWSGLQSLSGTVIVCGDLQLTGDVTVDAPANALLVIEDGQLDTNGYTFASTKGSGLTVVFSGDNSGSYTHAPTGGGTLNFAAPTSGTWSGVAIYQDPKLTSGVDISAAGNAPAWDITGLVYLPNSSVTFSGAVNKAGFGKSCFVLVVKDITVNGTGMILPNGECVPAGLAMPSTTIPGRATLVL